MTLLSILQTVISNALWVTIVHISKLVGTNHSTKKQVVGITVE